MGEDIGTGRNKELSATVWTEKEEMERRKEGTRDSKETRKTEGKKYLKICWEMFDQRDNTGVVAST